MANRNYLNLKQTSALLQVHPQTIYIWRKNDEFPAARRGELLNFTGIDSPYEVPEKPEFYFSTDKEDLDVILRTLLAKLNLSL